MVFGRDESKQVSFIKEPMDCLSVQSSQQLCMSMRWGLVQYLFGCDGNDNAMSNEGYRMSNTVKLLEPRGTYVVKPAMTLSTGRHSWYGWLTERE